MSIYLVRAIEDGASLFMKGEVLLMLGEIENMPGHVAAVTRKGRVVWGWHAERFERLTEDET